jgi:hypothetical protein
MPKDLSSSKWGRPLVLQFTKDHCKEPKRVKARSLLCYWAVLGINMAELSRRLKLSLSGVSLSVKRGEKIAHNYGYELSDP